jgi:ABC-type multidrug transport system fused ATPase/permease subunit
VYPLADVFELKNRLEQLWKPKGSKYQLLWVTCSLLKRDIFLVTFWTLIDILLMILNPLLVRYLIGVLNQTLPIPSFYRPFHDQFPFPFALVLLLPVMQIMVMIASSQSLQVLKRILSGGATLLRLVSLDYLLNEDATKLRKSHLFQVYNRDTSVFVTAVFYFRWFVHKVCISVISIIMIWVLLGNAAILVMLLFGFVLFSSSLTGKWMVLKNAPVLEMNKTRIGLLTEFLDRIQAIKYSVKESFLKKKILAARDEEVYYYTLYLIADAVGRLLSVISGPLSVVGVIAIHIYATQTLDSSLIFSSLLYINMMQQNLLAFHHVVKGLFNSFDSIERLNGLFQDKIGNPELQKATNRSKMIAIQMKNVSWYYNEVSDSKEEDSTKDPFSLDSISLNIHRGTLVAIVGEVGSGKTSLLEALLGNLSMVPGSGPFETDGRFAYCSQKPWIMTGSIKDNILFGQEMDETKLHRIVSACGLVSDLNEFPLHWDTLLGEKGMNLSGGQKSRVALARAIYSEADIVLLDCPLAALDARVGSHVFEEAILGLLKGKTVLMVTHKLSILDRVNQIIVMEHGRIREHGTLTELTLLSDGYLSGWYGTKGEEPTQDSIRSGAGNMEGAESDVKTETNRVDKSSSSESKVKVVGAKETKKEGGVQWHVYRKYIQAMGWPQFGGLVIFSMINGGTVVILPSWLATWINQGSRDTFSFYSTWYLVIGGVQVLLVVGLEYAVRLITIRIASHLHNVALESIIHAVPRFFEVNPSGRILERFVGDIRQLEESFYSLGDVLSQSSDLLATVLLVSISSWISFLPIPVAIMLGFRVYAKYARAALEASRIRQLVLSMSTTVFKEFIDGTNTLKAYGTFAFARKHFIYYLDDYQNAVNFAQGVQNWYEVRISLVAMMVVFVVWIVNVQMIVSEQSSFDAFNAVAITYSILLISTFTLFLSSTATFQSSMSRVERLVEYIEEVDHEKERQLHTDPPEQDWPTEGTIQFDQLSAAYPSEPDVPILKSLSFEIKGGEKIGVVGRTGAGKSTIAACLFRILDAFQGHIYIDGKDTQQLGLETLRSRMFIILQDPVLFEGTFRSNLDPDERFSDDEIWDALQRCGLKQHFETLPEKLDQLITEGGDQLSLGQKQLFMIVTALLKKPKILVLDESTSAMDDDSDKSMQRVIKECFPNTTVISIAHRLDTIVEYDRVLVLERGQITDYDTPHALLMNRDSIFSQMAKASGTTQYEQLVQKAKKQ